MLNKIQSVTCEACGKGTSSFQVHATSCLLYILGSCDCPTNESLINLNKLNIHGRTLELCDECHAKELGLVTDNKNQDTRVFSESLERQVIHRIKEEHQNFDKWQDIYVTERRAWVVENFESIDDMKEKLIDFIVSMEKLEWEIKSKRRAAFDAGKELDSRLSKEDRDRLISDPSFKPPTNKEYKKITKEREVDSVIKSLDLTGATKEQRRAAEGLLKLGMSVEDIKKTIKLKEN